MLKQRCMASPQCLAHFRARINELAQTARTANLLGTFDRTVALIRTLGDADPRALHTVAAMAAARERVRRRLVNFPAAIHVPEACEDREILGRTYSFCSRRMTFDAAHQDCVGRGGNLVWYRAPGEEDAVDAVAATYASAWWIGLTNLTANDGSSYQWLRDGTAPVFTRWRRGEPNNWHGIENCAQTVINDGVARWNDVACEAGLPYICKR